jgi:hypothetical protein
MYFDAALNSMPSLQFPSFKLAIRVQSGGKFAVALFMGQACAFCFGWKR